MVIIINENSISISASGVVTGNICVQHQDEFFPTPVWNDFILVVLTWFNFAFISIVVGDSDSCLVDFMDGPYAIEMRKSINKNEINIIGLSGSDRRNINFSSTLSTRGLCTNLLDSSGRVLEKLKDLKFLSEDSKKLKESTRQLSHALLRIKL